MAPTPREPNDWGEPPTKGVTQIQVVLEHLPRETHGTAPCMDTRCTQAAEQQVVVILGQGEYVFPACREHGYQAMQAGDHLRSDTKAHHEEYVAWVADRQAAQLAAQQAHNASAQSQQATQ